MRRTPFLFVVLLAGCPGDELRTYDLKPEGGSGVTGTVELHQSSGKSGLGELRWSFSASDPDSRTLVGFVRAGRCEALGFPVHPNALVNDDSPVQLHAGGEGRPVGGETIDAYRDDYAFAVQEESANGAVLACANL